jgi:5TMR of 5TMR-LYT.
LLVAVPGFEFPARRLNKGPKFFSGLVFGAATIIVMMTSILIQPGLWLWTDSGTVVVSVSALLYGPVSGGHVSACRRCI